MKIRKSSSLSLDSKGDSDPFLHGVHLMTLPLGIPCYQTLRCNILSFLDRCAPSSGDFDEAAWEAAGENSLHSPTSLTFVIPEKERKVRTLSLKERIDSRNWAFASTPGGIESIEGGHSAVETLFFFGELQRLPAAAKGDWVNYFNRYQDPETGYYIGPYVPPPEHPSWKDGRACSHPWEHMQDHLASSLCPTLMLLGGQSRFPLSKGSMTGRFLDRAYLEHYLRGRDWRGYQNDLDYRRGNPWWMGNEFWYPAALLWQIATWEEGSPAAQKARQMLDEVWYPWHDANFSSCGTWIGDLDGDPSLWWHGNLPQSTQATSWENSAKRHWAAFPLMGGAHQLWFYNFENHPIPES
ncbi:MAG: hypothetical protein HQL31_12435, partial [Planctomycetes bacterium]|nr:hypothetical protein [Planctomycetota bacterium]